MSRVEITIVITSDGAVTVSQEAKPARQMPGAGPITEPQLRALHTLLNKTGFTNASEQLSYCVGWVKRELSSTSDLTKVEASFLIDDLGKQLDDERMAAMVPEKPEKEAK